MGKLLPRAVFAVLARSLLERVSMNVVELIYKLRRIANDGVRSILSQFPGCLRRYEVVDCIGMAAVVRSLGAKGLAPQDDTSGEVGGTHSRPRYHLSEDFGYGVLPS